jgi:N-acyl-D-aspartate/D-glutamate deacylase
VATVRRTREAKVWVNGQLVFDGGETTGNRPGRPIRRIRSSD